MRTEYKLNDKQVCAAFVLYLGIKELRAPATMRVSLHPSGSAVITIEEPEPPEPMPAEPPPPTPRPLKELPAYVPAAYTKER